MAELLEFEEPIGILLKEIEALSALPESEQRKADIARLEARLASIRGEIYSRLTPWQRVLVARHPSRPTTLDYIERLFTEFVEIHGDRRFADDHAIVAAWRATTARTFSSSAIRRAATPSRRSIGTSATRGPRAIARRCGTMQMAQKFDRSIVCFVDTPAAYPGIESEERGVAEAIALNLREMAMLTRPGDHRRAR